MSDADVSYSRWTSPGAEHRLQIRQEQRSGRDDYVDIAKERLRLIERDDPAHVVSSEFA